MLVREIFGVAASVLVFGTIARALYLYYRSPQPVIAPTFAPEGELITPRRPSTAVDLAALKPPGALDALRLTGRSAQLTDETVADLRATVAKIRERLLAGRAEDLSTACKHLTGLWYKTGRGWRRYLNVSDEFGAARTILDALMTDTRPLMLHVARVFTNGAPGSIRKTNAGFAICCSVCGKDAVTVDKKDSVVNVSRKAEHIGSTQVDKERVTRLLALLHESDLATLLQDKSLTPYVDAYCPECDRVYCGDHLAIESTWSGSWLESVYATCPLRHDREIA